MKELKKQSENNQLNHNKKSLYINKYNTNNYFKCKWTKFSNQKTQNG